MSTISIQPISTLEEQQWCARLMAASEPWISLNRSFEDGMILMHQPADEIQAFIAIEASTPLGFVLIKLKGAFVGYIQVIAVSPQARGKGIGSLLLDYVEAIIFQKSPNAFICVSSFNHRARKLYESRGYQLLGTLDNYLENGFSEHLLRKTLGSINDFRAKKLSNV
jgi:[ribosomal protein S18]-alanine N-acetyltransferase